MLEEIVKKPVDLEATTINAYDEKDFNEMLCPQYGHSIGHAIEHLSWKAGDCVSLLHAEACVIRMCISADVSYLLLGFCDL